VPSTAYIHIVRELIWYLLLDVITLEIIYCYSTRVLAEYNIITVTVCRLLFIIRDLRLFVVTIQS
jgi:hypothetical protein